MPFYSKADADLAMEKIKHAKVKGCYILMAPKFARITE
jgi:hypothetical protein